MKTGVHWVAGLLIAASALSPGAAAAATAPAPAGAQAPASGWASADLRTWMGENRSVLGGRPLNRIVMPGSHDAGSWSITRNSGVCDAGDQASISRTFPSIAASMSRSQSGTLVQQLDGGARYVDLRLCKQGGKWFTYHGGPMGNQFFDSPASGGAPAVSGEVDAVADWIARHPQEIVIIRLSTAAAPDTARAANTEAATLLADAIGGGPGHPALADGSLTPDSTYDQYLAAGRHVVLIDDKATTGQPWAWGPGAQTYRGSYVQADTHWTDFVKALFDRDTLQKNFDAVLGRGDQVLDKDPGDTTGKFFVLQSIIDPSLSIPDLVVAQGLEKIGAMPSSVTSQYLLHLENQLNPQILAKLRGDWSGSNISENMNIVMTDDVNQDRAGVRAGELQREIIARNTPPTTPHTFHSATGAPDGTWTGPRPLSGAGTSLRFVGSQVSAAALPDGSTQVTGTGIDGNLYHNIRRADGGWQGWALLPGAGKAGAFKASASTITGLPDGSSQLVAVGTDGVTYHTVRHPDGSWQGWAAMSAGPGTGALLRTTQVAAAGMPDGSTRVLVFGEDGRMRLGTRQSDGSWSAWSIVAGVNAPDFRGRALAIAALPGGEGQLVAIGTDGNIWHTVLRADGSLQGWNGPSGVDTPMMGARALAITGLPNGDSRVLAVGLDGNVHHTTRDRGGAWTPFRPLPGRAGAGAFAGDRVALAGLPDGSSQVLMTTR
ncbi:hypothetical protein AB0P12_11660 [Streptomyces subrutilus]|uniref:hypothetical protein n=1 Tax=Streptomyces subrutilus TaxID=36818 RepID=UPI003445AC62